MGFSNSKNENKEHINVKCEVNLSDHKPVPVSYIEEIKKPYVK